jgi:hypothetical protein
LYDEFKTLTLQEKKNVIGADYLNPYSLKHTDTETEVLFGAENKSLGYTSYYLISQVVTPDTYNLYTKFANN